MGGVGGWLLVYLLASLPVVTFYAAALSGWRHDYPIGLFLAILLVQLAPPALVVMKVPSAPVWNVTALWVGASLVVLRIVAGVRSAARERLTMRSVAILISVVIWAMAWAAMWTTYFLVSDRVARTFG